MAVCVSINLITNWQCMKDDNWSNWTHLSINWWSSFLLSLVVFCALASENGTKGNVFMKPFNLYAISTMNDPQNASRWEETKQIKIGWNITKISTMSIHRLCLIEYLYFADVNITFFMSSDRTSKNAAWAIRKLHSFLAIFKLIWRKHTFEAHNVLNLIAKYM